MPAGMDYLNNFKSRVYAANPNLAANPSDPMQQLSWMQRPPDYLSQFTPENIQKIMGLLQPFFDKQTGNLNRLQTSSLGDARRAGGAAAAAGGYDPQSFISRNQGQVFDSFAPRFDALSERQEQAPFGVLGQQYNSLLNQGEFDWRKIQSLMQNRQYEDSQEFDFFRDLMPGLLSGGSNVLSSWLGK